MSKYQVCMVSQYDWRGLDWNGGAVTERVWRAYMQVVLCFCHPLGRQMRTEHRPDIDYSSSSQG